MFLALNITLNNDSLDCTLKLRSSSPKFLSVLKQSGKNNFDLFSLFASLSNVFFIHTLLYTLPICLNYVLVLLNLKMPSKLNLPLRNQAPTRNLDRQKKLFKLLKRKIKIFPVSNLISEFIYKDSSLIEPRCLLIAVIEYPLTQSQRNEYISTKTGKRVTPFQYKVYDLVQQIPAGHVTSYKVLSDTLQSAPRAVGQALKLNPFCPLPVACHRVIAADRTIGGFAGGSGDHQLTADKKAKLQLEGCVFAENYIYKANADGSTEFFSDFAAV